MVMQACNPNTGETEEGRSQVPGLKGDITRSYLKNRTNQKKDPEDSVRGWTMSS